MKFVPNSVSSKVARTALQFQKSSPRTLFVVGLVGMGTTVVLAARATLKVEDILDTVEKDLEKINQARTQADELQSDVFTESDARRTKGLVYLRAAGDFGKIYGPAVVVGALSVSCLVGSHNILSRRNASLVAAYGTLERAFAGYRERVRNEIGDEREHEVYHGVEVCEIADEKGKTVKKKVSAGQTPYSFLFDQYNVNWEPVPEANMLFLKLQQQYANQRLQAKGHVFLNEVLESIGMEHTKAGAVTGWIANEGDNFIDFGIFIQGQEERLIDFMVGREKAIWLDFNVDGVIFDKI